MTIEMKALTRKAFGNELTDNILNYWVTKVYDPRRKTFIGYIGPDEKPNPDAPLGAVLVSRLVWTFSNVCQVYPNAVYQTLADEAFRIVSEQFWDKENGGVYWEVKPDGTPTNASKQFYAQSFAIYALSEYARVFSHQRSKEMAISLFRLLEKYAFDPVHGGYLEAASREWKMPERDFITPPGDKMNKSMNTHLHILESYANLYRVWPQPELKEKIRHILEIFLKHIINRENYHFHMFFDNDWSMQSTAISYGHDIEGSWLLHEAAEVTGDREMLEKLEPVLLKMADAVGREAIDKEGGLYNESDGSHWDRDFHWWPQAEAVVGFYNAFQLSGDPKFKVWAENAWNFIQKHQVDHKNGEWHWLITPDYQVKQMVKVSPWKCPYHNGRMCLEMLRRLPD